jgi:hypothetical protein
MRSEELAAQDLLEKTRESDDLTVDALLALLAYASHGETAPLIGAREQGAEIGAVGLGAHRLRDRCYEELSQ